MSFVGEAVSLPLCSGCGMAQKTADHLSDNFMS